MDYKKLSIEELKRIIVQGVPAEQRMAAIELYERGERDYAINLLIEQMNLYKDPKAHDNVKRETCMAAAAALGRLKDERAIKPLFDGLGEISRGAAAYALAKINGKRVEEELIKLVSLENKKGIHAVIALGFMKSHEVVDIIIYLIEHSKEFEEKYKNVISMEMIFGTIGYGLRILGSYINNRVAEDNFKKFLKKTYIGFFLSGYVSFEKCPQSHFIDETEWEIVKKYGWDKYLDTEEKRYAFTYSNPDKWVEDLRNEIVDEIWQEIKGDKS